jgi:hypothetical protein
MVQKQKTRGVCHLEAEEGERNGSTHEFSLSELQEQVPVRGTVERKRSMKPPEKTLPNGEYIRKLREGLEKMIRG